jgi:aromatic-L-amino-acid/L-tryptophan decarboxylase
MPFEQVLDTVALASQKAINNSGPGFMAYIPGGGLYTSALADVLAGGFNRYVTFAGTAPALAHMEATVLRWLCDIFDYPQEARGVLTSGGSMANFSAVVVARKAKLGDGLVERRPVHVGGVTRLLCQGGLPGRLLQGAGPSGSHR